MPRNDLWTQLVFALNRNELITGKRYYAWELIHENNVIVAYESVREMVQDKEATANRYINGFLLASALLLLVAFVGKLSLGG